jgi:hypothetical protein
MSRWKKRLRDRHADDRSNDPRPCWQLPGREELGRMKTHGQIKADELRRGRIRSIGASLSGRVLDIAPPSEGAAARAVTTRQEAGMGVLFALLLVMPLFGQFFHYMVDAGPLYYLSKAWPFLTLPLAVYGLMALRTPHHNLYIACLVYVLAITPALSIYWLGNSFVDALGTTIKVWPLCYYFSMLGALVLMKPSPAVLRQALLALGIISLGALWFLWIVVPRSHYATDPTLSKLFLFEVERGYRIYLPETFTILLIFYCTHRLLQRPAAWHVLLIPFALASMLIIYKQRLAIAVTVLMVGWIILVNLPKALRTLALSIGCVGAAGGAFMLMRHAEGISNSLGGSLSIRQTSMRLLSGFLLDEPARWIFGAGGTTRFGSITMADIIGRKDFYLADLGWAGVIFEYGVFGGLLLLLLYVAAIRQPLRLRPVEGVAPEEALRQAALYGSLHSYAIYLLLVTAVYSPVFTPGELASVTAILLYLGRRWWRPAR